MDYTAIGWKDWECLLSAVTKQFLDSDCDIPSDNLNVNSMLLGDDHVVLYA
jgi:hypothetical protein